MVSALARTGCALLAALAMLPVASGAIVPGQVDRFESGASTQGWSGGSSPTVVQSGGEDGEGDAYLEISAIAAPLGTRNRAQWTGDYLAAGVDEVQMHLQNFGPSPVELRLLLVGPGGTFTSTNSTLLLPALGWVSASFLLVEEEMTKIRGPGTLADALADVSNLLIRHDANEPSPPGSQGPVTATLGIDDITALPEPAGSALLPVLGALLAMAPRARTRRRPDRARQSLRRGDRSRPPHRFLL